MHVVTHFLRWSVGAAAAETQTSVAERAALARNAFARRTVVEIGVWHGVTTSLLKRSMDPSGVLYAVDPFPRGRLGICLHSVIAHREVARTPGASVPWLRMTGQDAAARAAARGDLRPDFVFIDGDHSYEGLRADWLGWSPLVTPGGMIALHDSHATEACPIGDAGSVRFTEAHILSDPRYVLAEVVETLTLMRRQ